MRKLTLSGQIIQPGSNSIWTWIGLTLKSVLLPLYYAACYIKFGNGMFSIFTDIFYFSSHAVSFTDIMMFMALCSFHWKVDINRKVTFGDYYLFRNATRICSFDITIVIQQITDITWRLICSNPLHGGEKPMAYVFDINSKFLQTLPCLERPQLGAQSPSPATWALGSVRDFLSITFLALYLNW